METTTISIKKDTLEILKELGRKGETYDIIIKKVIKQIKMRKLDERWNKILGTDEFISLDEL